MKKGKHVKHTTPKILVGLLALVVLPSTVMAAGFNIYEQSAKASGLAGAWVAQADDAAANWYNPAALVWLEDSEFQIGTNFITAGEDSEFTSSDIRFGLVQEQTFEAEGSIETPSHLYFAQKVHPNVAYGIGINNPFGLVTDWQTRPVSFSAARSELVTFFVNANVAFRLTEHTSIAVGIAYVDADLKEFSREVPIDLDGNPLNGFSVIGHSNLSGTGDDTAWNVALHHKQNNWSFGLTYRSDVTVGIDGNVRFSNFGPISQFFVDSPGTADLKLPDMAAIGFAWSPGANSSWTFETDIAWAGWSVFDSLQVDITNNVPGFVDDIDLREDWDDTLSYRFGAVKRTGNAEWRFGAVFDEQTVPADTLRASIPDAERYAPTIGYGRQGNKWSFDAYYMALFTSESTAIGTEEGVIQGEFSSFAHLGGVTLTRRF